MHVVVSVDMTHHLLGVRKSPQDTQSITSGGYNNITRDTCAFCQVASYIQKRSKGAALLHLNDSHKRLYSLVLALISWPLSFGPDIHGG